MTKENNQMPVYNFSSFSEEKARRAFGLKSQLQPEGFLDKWLNNAKEEEITEEEDKRLHQLQRKLNLFVRGWTEVSNLPNPTFPPHPYFSHLIFRVLM